MPDCSLPDRHQSLTLHTLALFQGFARSLPINPVLEGLPFFATSEGLPSPLVTRLFKSQAQTVHAASIKQVKLFLASLPSGEGGRLPVQGLEVTGCSPERPNHNSPRLFVVFDPGHPVLKCIFQLLKRGLRPRHQQFVQKTKMLVHDRVGWIIVLVGGLLDYRLCRSKGHPPQHCSMLVAYPL